MAILMRRSLQTLLDELAVQPKLLENLVARLNVCEKSALETEWEPIVLGALSTIGVVDYEPQLGGTSNLDFRLTTASGLALTGEISALSDDETARQNPIDLLTAEIDRRLEQRQIRGGISISVGSSREGRAVSLIIPPPHQFTPHIFNRDFALFLDAIVAAPHKSHSFRVSSKLASVAISYAPGRWHSTITYAPFKSPRDIVRNPLYNRLKKKVDQIKRGPSPNDGGLRGIVICDGDCELFTHWSSQNGIGMESICRHFLRKTQSIDFIAALTVKDEQSYDRTIKPYRFDVRVFDHGREREEMLVNILQEGLQNIPRPARTAVNARLHLERKKRQGLTFLDYTDRRGARFCDGEMRISARAVMDYLVGRIDRKRFNVLADEWFLSTLKRTLDEGGLVSSMRLSPSSDTDDDELVIQWRDKDAATSPLTTAKGDPNGAQA